MPPYLFLELHELLPAFFEGGEQDPTVEVRLAFGEEDGDVPAYSDKHVADDVQVLEPGALRSLFQDVRA